MKSVILLPSERAHAVVLLASPHHSVSRSSCLQRRGRVVTISIMDIRDIWSRMISDKFILDMWIVIQMMINDILTSYEIV